MTNYYYLVASLPSLVFDKPAPITIQKFWEYCLAWCTNKEITLLKEPSFTNPIITSWLNYNLELNHLLKNKKNQEQANFNSDLRKILESENPLSKEIAYEKSRWNYLDSLESMVPFKFEFLFIYQEKLKILERLKKFDQEEGKKSIIKSKEYVYEKAPR